MNTPPSDGLRRASETPEAMPQAHESRSDDAPSETPGLARLIQLREEFARDVNRIEETLARGAVSSPGLYEQLLRSRRVSGKLDNRIELVRLQQEMRGGK